MSLNVENLKIKWEHDHESEQICDKHGKNRTLKLLKHTKCKIINNDSGESVVAVAEVSDGDKYHASRDFGRRLSLRRAIQKMYPNRKSFFETRQKIWRNYLQLMG